MMMITVAQAHFKQHSPLNSQWHLKEAITTWPHGDSATMAEW